MSTGKLTAQRFNEIDETLNHVSNFFLQLSTEIGEVTPEQNRPDRVYTASLIASIRRDIEKLQLVLAEQAAWDRIVNASCT